MKKIVQRIICSTLFFASLCFSKVAYLPLFDATDRENPLSHSILTIDLETGHLLRKIYVGDGVGAVFINKFGDQLYASAEKEHKIALIDTTSLTVKHEWKDLPIKPQQIILNNAEDKLYFAEYKHDEIYQIDLTDGQVSLALNLAGFQRFWYSDNLNHIVFKTHDPNTNSYQLHTYDLNTMSLVYQKPSGDNLSLFVSDDGVTYYLPLFSFSRLYSLNLNNTDSNWFFSHAFAPGPLGDLLDIFSFVKEQPENNKLLVVGWHGTYEVDINTGEGRRISYLRNLNQPYIQVEENTYLKSTVPQLPICISPFPGVDCYNYYPMQVFIHDHNTGTESLIYERDRSGSLARGRYVGDLLYSPPVISTLNFWGISILALLLIFLAKETVVKP